MRNVLGQLAQTNLAAAWAIFGKNRPISKKSVHLTSQSSTAQKKQFEMLNRLGVPRAHQLLSMFK